MELTNILKVQFICIDYIPATWHGMGGFCEIFVTNLSILANLNPLNNHKRMIQLLQGTIVEVKSRVNCIFG